MFYEEEEEVRKDNSEFITEFITKSGNFKKNRDYFAYVELDDMACWVLADGLDSSPDMLSAEIAAGSILNDFTENPSMKRRHIKKYIKNAHQALLHESRLMKLQSTVLVIVSDYSSLIWGSVGNARLYHLRNERINRKSKDHSIAQMLVDAGEVEEKRLNQHQERNNLTEYLGKDGTVKPYVSKKLRLRDDDFLLMCTSGFWENINDQELVNGLKEANDAKEFVEGLESKILNTGNDLDNYSIASLFIKKAFQEDKSRKKLYKKIAIFLIPILILGSGFFIYSKISKRRLAKTLKLKNIKKASTNNNEGDRLFKEGKYNKALIEYNKARNLYKKSQQKEKLVVVDKKIKETGRIIAGRKLEEDGDKSFATGNYRDALSKYKEAKLNYLKAGEYNLSQIEDKLTKTNDTLKAINYENEGDLFFKSEELPVAMDKYMKALKIYRKNEMSAREKKVKADIQKIEKLITNNQRFSKAQEVEVTGDELFKLKDFKNAILKYTEAKIIYSELGMTEEVNSIKKKLRNIGVLKAATKAKEYETTADRYLEKEEYSEALANYKDAYKIFNTIGKEGSSTRVEEKIDKSERLIKAKELLAEGDALFKVKDFKNANLKYMKAELIYLNFGLTDKVKTIKKKINNVRDAESYLKAKDYERLADMQLESKKYEKALYNYGQANKIYSEINKPKASERIQKKIKKTKEAKDKFLFFF